MRRPRGSADDCAIRRLQKLGRVSGVALFCSTSSCTRSFFRARAALTVLLASNPACPSPCPAGLSSRHLASVSRDLPTACDAAVAKVLSRRHRGSTACHRARRSAEVRSCPESRQPRPRRSAPPTSGNAPGPARPLPPASAQLQAFSAARQQTLEKAQISAPCSPVGLGLAQLLGQALLGGALGREQALGGVRYLARLGVGFLQLHRLPTQALKFLLRALVQTGDALAELERPQRQPGRKTQHNAASTQRTSAAKTVGSALSPSLHCTPRAGVAGFSSKSV